MPEAETTCESQKSDRPLTDFGVCRHRVPSVDVCLVDNSVHSLEQHLLLHQHRGLASLGSMYADEAGAESPQRLEHLGRLDHTGDAHEDESETAASTRTPHAHTAQPGASAAGRAENATLGRGHKKTGKSTGDKSGALNGCEKRDHPSRSVRHAASGIGRRHGGARRVPRPPLPCRQGKGQRGGETGDRGGNGCNGRGDACGESVSDDATSPDDALHACAQALTRLMVSMCARQRVV